MGYAYLEGIGVEKDTKAAFLWTLKGANLGDRDAQFNLGYMYENGIYVEQNKSTALEWFNKAALQEHNLAIKKSLMHISQIDYYLYILKYKQKYLL